MSTAPFDPSVARVILDSHQQTLIAEAVAGDDGILLALEDYSVVWDENRSPRVSAVLTCALPDDDSTLELLDPRTPVRVYLTASYRLDNGETTSAIVANLGLRSRRVSRPRNQMVLVASSDEALIIDASPAVPFFEGSTVHASAATYIKNSVPARLAGSPAAGMSIVDTTPASSVTFETDAYPTDWWSTFVTAADSIDADLYDNGDRVLRISPRTYRTADTVLALTVGERGTIVESDATLDRDEWANQVRVLWRWDNTSSPGTPDRRWGTAIVTAGPYTYAQAGDRLYAETRTGKVDQYTADQVARTLLRRSLARARSYRVVAIGAWWVRPGHTVTVQLPTGLQERMLVAAVEFRGDNLMTLTLRLPDISSVIGE